LNDEDDKDGKFLPIAEVVRRLRGACADLTAETIRAAIDAKELPCAVYWITRRQWLFIDPGEAARHEKCGWPRWAAPDSSSLYPSADNPSPPIIYFTDDATHPNVSDELGRGGGLMLANFRGGLFVPKAALRNWSPAAGVTVDERTAVTAPRRRFQLKPVNVERGYITALREYLQAASDRGESIPKAIDVLAAWQKNPPHGIEVAEGLRAFTYAVDGEKVAERPVSARNLGRSIKAHTEPCRVHVRPVRHT
jgi:hypothetical protein